MLFEPLFTHAARQPQQLAIVDDWGSYTYQQLATSAGRMGTAIRLQTTRPQVALLLPNGVNFLTSFYGALLAGKTVVPLNYLLGNREIAHVVADSEVDAVLTVPPLAGRLQGLPVNVVDVTQVARTVTDDPQPLPAPLADSVAVLMYTSGTGGLPKGVPLTYANLQSNVDASIAHVNLEGSHRFLGVVPLFHAFGMTAMMLAPIQLGATIVYMSRFSPVGMLSAIRAHGISLVGGVPSMFAALLRMKEASADDFKSIYAMISGGEPLPGSLREAFLARFGVPLYEAYGMTETGLAISLNTPQMNKPGSAGKPIPGMLVRIIDDMGNHLPHGQPGEICVKGPMVLKEYHKLPRETAAAFTPDGYFKTGDLGRFDEDGFLYITGRKKDLIIVAGEKASPREIEETLMSHPAVAEAAVVGRKDTSRGEVVVAFVIPREGQSPASDELREFCRGQGLAQWKVPREIRIVQDLPRSPTGKVLKRVLAEQLSE